MLAGPLIAARARFDADSDRPRAPTAVARRGRDTDSATASGCGGHVGSPLEGRARPRREWGAQPDGSGRPACRAQGLRASLVRKWQGAEPSERRTPIAT
jgi:hypothetical protein